MSRRPRTPTHSPIGRRQGLRPVTGWRLSAVAGVVALAVVFSVVSSAAHIRSATAATVSVANPSLETDANSNGMPDCWQRQGQGRNKYSFVRSTTPHTGKYAERVTISRYSSGAQGLLVQMGSSDCGPSVTPGHTYTLTTWYTSSAGSHFTAFYRNASGSWVSWINGSALPTASGWTQASYVTPALPTGATEISFGLEVQSVGSLTTDDYALVDSGSTTASPTTSPSTATSSPTTSTASTSPTSASTTTSAPASPTTSPTSSTSATTSSAPPPASGYYPALVAPGNVSALPSGSSCANAVHRSTWEPRPDNYKPNHVLVDPTAVHNSFAARPRSGSGTYDPRWDSWLLPRVDGQFTGTTDEIIQWAACKWGLPDNYLRAEADTESTWFQYDTYPSGRCVDMYGCGDWFSSEAYTARKTYCNELATVGGYDYQKDYGDGLCPKTFSIIGIMSWWNPSWGLNWAGNQNGTFPFTRNSTAMAMDYMASQIRGCYEGWQWELGSSYKAGDLWGCAGAWYSGGWHDSGATTYISHVQANESAEPWLTTSFATMEPSCSATYGCPGPETLS
jgi:hypothetical protein